MIPANTDAVLERFLDVGERDTIHGFLLLNDYKDDHEEEDSIDSSTNLLLDIEELVEQSRSTATAIPVHDN